VTFVLKIRDTTKELTN